MAVIKTQFRKSSNTNPATEKSSSPRKICLFNNPLKRKAEQGGDDAVSSPSLGCFGECKICVTLIKEKEMLIQA